MFISTSYVVAILWYTNAPVAVYMLNVSPGVIPVMCNSPLRNDATSV